MDDLWQQSLKERPLENIVGSKLHSYYLTHSENKLLVKIIEEYHPLIHCDYIYNSRYLYYCYEEIIKANALDIISEIVIDGKTSDELIISLVSIKHNRIEILELLNARDFNFDQIISKELSDPINILTYAYLMNGLDMVKYFISLGANVNHGDGILLKNACHKQDECMVDYLLTFEISEENLLIALIATFSPRSENTSPLYNIYMETKEDNPSMEKINMTIINKIIDTGLNIAKHSKRLHFVLSKKPLALTKLLLEKGLVISDNMPLLFACGHNNLEVVEFYLQYGLLVNEDI